MWRCVFCKHAAPSVTCITWQSCLNEYGLWTLLPYIYYLDNRYDKDLVAERILPTSAFFDLLKTWLDLLLIPAIFLLIEISAVSVMLSPFTSETY